MTRRENEEGGRNCQTDVKTNNKQINKKLKKGRRQQDSNLRPQSGRDSSKGRFESLALTTPP